jgi:hypothetical protein
MGFVLRKALNNIGLTCLGGESGGSNLALRVALSFSSAKPQNAFIHADISDVKSI